MKRLSGLVLLILSCGGRGEPFSVSEPNCSADIFRHQPSGWLITEPLIVFDFWGDWNQATISPEQVHSDWVSLVGTNKLLERLSEYSVHTGMVDPTFYLNTSVNDTDDASFSSSLNEEIKIGNLPYPTDQTIFVIVLLPGHLSKNMANRSWGGYHQHAKINSQQYAYAIVKPDYSIISHELYEAATDPDNGGGYWNPSEAEIGDLCNDRNEIIGGFVVQKVFSQALCQCF